MLFVLVAPDEVAAENARFTVLAPAGCYVLLSGLCYFRTGMVSGTLINYYYFTTAVVLRTVVDTGQSFHHIPGLPVIDGNDRRQCNVQQCFATFKAW